MIIYICTYLQGANGSSNVYIMHMRVSMCNILNIHTLRAGTLEGWQLSEAHCELMKTPCL